MVFMKASIVSTIEKRIERLNRVITKDIENG